MTLFSKLNQIKDLKSQAKQMKNMLDEQVIEVEKHGITLKMNGNNKVQSINIPENTNNEDLQKYLPELFNEAVEKNQKLMADKMRSGEISMPNLNF